MENLNKDYKLYPLEWKPYIHENFSLTARKYKTKVAIVSEKENITYEELEQQSSRLALHLILARDTSNAAVIGICTERSCNYIIGVLGILKAGHAFMPIDHQYPEERIKYILNDSKVTLLIVDKKFKKIFDSNVGSDIKILCFDDEFKNTATDAYIKSNDDFPLENLADDKELAYVIYTSGSTGEPKGVMIEHKSVLNLVEWHLNTFDVKDYENASCFSSFAFDASIWEIFPYLLNGNTLYICPNNVRHDLLKLNNYFQDNNIKIAFLPTALCELFFEFDNTSLRILLTGGEQLTRRPSLQAKYTLFNNYGPTETTVVATYTPVNISKSITIGKPITNVEVYILDEYGKLVEDGLIGELCIAGIGVAKGYLNNDVLTAKKFVSIFKDNKTKRIYKTGDLVRRNKDGDLEFLGRIDDQIKIRGYRVDVGEIEKALLSLPIIKECAVILKNTEIGNQLVAFYLRNEHASRDIRDDEQEYLKYYLNLKLPNFMVPQLYQAIEKMPLNQNGKKDKVFLQKLPIDNISKYEYEAPSNLTEQLLATVWKKFLNLKKIGINSNLFSLGANSLICMQALVKINTKLNTSISMEDIFINPTIKGLSILCEKSSLNKCIYPVPVNGQDHLPLTQAQYQMWLLDSSDKVPRYNVPFALQIKGIFSIENFKKALEKLIIRHEILRTSIIEINGAPLQKINQIDSATVLPIEIINFEGISQDENSVLTMMNADAMSFFLLSEKHLFRIKIFILSSQKHIIYFNFHHSIFDAWSLKIFFRDLGALYNDKESILPRLNVQHSAYTLYELKVKENNEVEYQQGINYWKEKLMDVDHNLQLTTDFFRPKENSGIGKKYYFYIEKPLFENLKFYAEYHKTTIFIILLSALYILLTKYTKQTSICIGTVLANRDHAEIQDLIGCFINTVALPIKHKNSDGIFDIVEQVKKITTEAQKYKQVAFKDVVSAVQPIREGNNSPIFQVMFNMLYPGRVCLELNKCEVENILLEHDVSVFDLSFIAESIDDNIKMSIQYRKDLFAEETISNMSAHYVNIIENIIKNEHLRINDINFLSREEHECVIRSFNDTSTFYPKEKSIFDVFLQQVKKHPNNIAIEYCDTIITYEEATSKCVQLSYELLRHNLANESLVGIFLDKSPNVIISMLAILKCGYAYVPLDIEYPEERLSYILHDSGIKLIITTQKYKEKLEKIIGNNISIFILEEDTNIYEITPNLLSNEINNFSIPATNLAYVIYTSGSTGKPKGVMAEHQGVIRLVKNTNYISINENETFFQLSSLSFDAATFEIWGALLNGAKLVIPSCNKFSLHEIAANINKSNVSIVFLTSILFKILIEQYYNKLPSLRIIIAGGESVDFKDAINLYLKNNKNSCFIHAYGPTENTTFTTCYQIKEQLIDQRLIPIGKAISNTEVYILDENLQPTAIGIPGILFTAGDGLARGYINKPELTSEKFIFTTFNKESTMPVRLYNTGDLARWLPDGNIEFLGRIDNQVKIRGFRIELEEIESIINKHECISECVVLAEGTDVEKHLVAYFVKTNEALSSTEVKGSLRKFLLKKLPSYMIPVDLLCIPSIPLNPNGKIDKSKLSLYKELPEKKIDRPENELQKKLVKIWENVLKVDKIGIYDNFFDLGGDSIKNILIVDKARQQEINLNVQDIFRHGNIYLISNSIEKNQLLHVVDENFHVDEYNFGPSILSPSQIMVLNLNKDCLDKSSIGMSFKIKNSITFEELKMALEKLITQHKIFSLSFQNDLTAFKPYYNIFPVDCFLEHLKNYGSINIRELSKRIEYKLRDSIDLEKGPLLKVSFNELIDETENLLVVVMHHLVTDAFSWKIFIEDLCYYINNPDADLLKKTTSYHYWCSKLLEYSKCKEVISQKDYWQKIIKEAEKMPRIIDINGKKTLQEISLKIDADLVKEIKLYTKIARVRIDVFFLSALYKAYATWSNSNSIPLLLANNGRTNIFNDVMLSRTIGLFTVIFPMIIGNEQKNNFSFYENLLNINNKLANIRYDGIEYLMLKYIVQDLTLDSNDISFIFFNYMGNFGSQRINDDLTRIDDLSDREITQEVSHKGISIVGMETDDVISFVFGTSIELFGSRKLEELADLFQENLKSIVEEMRQYKYLSNGMIDLSLFVTLKEGNREKPVIFLPGQGGSCLNFSPLISSLVSPRSFYGIQTYGLNYNEEGFDSIYELAQYNIELLKLHFPKGPYTLIGYSYGGTVAFEMANQLHNLYNDVCELILIDAPPHDFSMLENHAIYMECILSHLNRSLKLEIPLKIIKDESFTVKNSNFSLNFIDTNLIKVALFNISAKYDIQLPDNSVIEKLIKMFNSQVNAVYNFDKKYVGKMTILLANDEITEGDISSDFRERILKWKEYVRTPIQYFRVSGNHFSMLQYPYVVEVAEILENNLLHKSDNAEINEKTYEII